MSTRWIVEALPGLPTSPEMRAVARKWERFVTGHDVDLSDLSPVIRESWLRSRQAGIDPALPHAPETVLPGDPALLYEEIGWSPCAEPVFAFVRDVLTEPHQFAVLSDARGRIFRSTGGNKALARAEECRAVPGGLWGEEHVGCCILGTSLSTGVPVQVCWQENYSSNWQDWISHSAPISNPLTHELIGAIGIAGYREFAHPRALALVMKAAHMIEANVREQEAARRLGVLERFIQLLTRYPSEGLLALDRRGEILALSPEAEKRLAAPPARLLGRRVSDIPELREFLGQLFSAETAARGKDLELSSGVTVFPIGSGQASGAVVLLPRLPARRTMKEHAPHAWTTTYTFADLVGRNPQFRACLELAARASQYDWPVLLLGESGTGKELVAQAIHHASPRRRGPFVVFSCASVTEELVGAELFGYSAGTFTGALKDGKVGKLQLAHTGALFLDDVDTMSPHMQVSVLRVLEEGRVAPLGASTPQRIDVRIIASTNADLERAVQEGRFRLDLYHRLNVLPIRLPPLRERLDDIPLLVEHFLARHAPGVMLTDEALRELLSRPWPGNVRELRNTLIAAAVRAPHGPLTTAELSPLQPSAPARQTATALPPLHTLKATERELIVQALRQTGSAPRAAAALGLHHTTLYRKMKKYKITLLAK